MKKLVFTLSLFFSLISISKAQGPGLVISEFLANPAGTDSPFEYVELVATRTIDFSLTPYSVVVCNNGAGTSAGWIAGGGLTYGFDISTGIVNQGDVVYVGGSTMAPTGTKLRVINTGTTNGDGFGNLNTGGVFGNGGANCDGIAVFALATTSLTSSTVPVDAIFFGTGTGTAVVSGGTAGYQLPYNDLYAGGKLQATSFLAPDAASTQVMVATAGIFNPTTQSFTTTRTFAIGTATDGATAITFSTVAGNVTFAMPTAPTNQTINETTASATFNVTITNANNAQAIVRVVPSGLSTATEGVDYTVSNPIVVAAAASTTAQTVTVNILNDALLEQKSEYGIFTLSPLTNASTTGANLHALYITDDDNVAPAASNELVFQLLGSYSNGTEGSNSAEIVAHDPSTQRLYIANSIGAKLDIVNFSNPAAPVLISSIPVTPTYGNINSVAVYNGLVACAIENSSNPQDSGKIVFFDASGNFINSLKVGAMPDMLTFNHAGNKVVVACEGEPNAAYTSDPEGRVCVIDVTGGAASLTQANVSFINFTAYNGQEATLRASGIRIYGPGATAAMDFEPEYVTISDDDQTAWVALQENNALAVVNLSTNTITQLLPLGYKDLSVVGNGFDGSDQTAGINIANFPIKSMTLPDALAHVTKAGTTYVVTANEGDSRAYAGFNEESRISAATLDPTAFPYAAQLKSNAVAGRLNITTKLGDIDNDGDLDELYSLGGRSFSIFNGTTGALVFDSGDDFERILSTHPTYANLFNASNTSGAAVAKNRSDDKGPECEGVTVAEINGEYFAFASLERIGGVMIYNITDPTNPVYVGYHNNRSFASNGPDRGAEGMIYIDAANSPNGNSIMLLANEISSTITVYQINTCKEKAGVNITSTNGITFCAGDSSSLYTLQSTGVNYQWYQNGNILAGESDTLLTVNTAGNYAVLYTSAPNACYDSSSVKVTVNALPTVTANATSTSFCAGGNTTLTGAGASSYVWNNSVTDGVSFSPNASATYNVIGTDGNGCSDTASVAITVNALPTVTANATSTSVCAGSNTTLTGGGASSYVWDNSVTDGVVFVPSSSTTYNVTGTDANGCQNTASVAITVNSLPTVVANATSTSVCAGSNTTLTGSGATSYVWDNSVTDGVAFAPSASTTYNVTGTDANGCENTASVAITLNTLPTVTASATSASLCAGDNTTLTGGGASSYVWDNSVTDGVAFTPSSSNTYNVIGTDVNGCENTASITVTVNALPDNTTNVTGFVITSNETGATYQWINCSTNAAISGEIAQSYTATANGDYAVVVTKNTCSDTSACVTISTIGINELTESNLIQVNPNPNNGSFVITTTRDVKKIIIIDILGKELMSFNPTASSTSVNLEAQPNGVYFIKAIPENAQTVKRFVIAN